MNAIMGRQFYLLHIHVESLFSILQEIVAYEAIFKNRMKHGHDVSTTPSFSGFIGISCYIKALQLNKTQLLQCGPFISSILISILYTVSFFEIRLSELQPQKICSISNLYYSLSSSRPPPPPNEARRVSQAPDTLQCEPGGPCIAQGYTTGRPDFKEHTVVVFLIGNVVYNFRGFPQCHPFVWGDLFIS